MPIPWVWARADTVGIAVTILVVLVAIVLPIYLIAKLLVFLFERLFGRRSKPSKPAETETRPRGNQAVVYLILIVFFGLMFWYVSPARAPVGAPAPAARAASNIPWIGLLGGLGVVAILVLFAATRSNDPFLKRAERQKRGNDLDGAITTLDEAIETRPTAPRANYLACLLIEKKDWSAAYKRLLQAGELGLTEEIYRGNMAHVLRMMDRPGDALNVLEPHVHSSTANLLIVCHYIESLMDLNRVEEAQAQIHRVEQMFQESIGLDSPYRKAVHQSIDHCRQRFEDRMGKKSAVVSDEL